MSDVLDPHTHRGDTLMLAGHAVGEKPRVVKYVGGPRPYFWIGSESGVYYADVDADALYDFIDGVRED